MRTYRLTADGMPAPAKQFAQSAQSMNSLPERIEAAVRNGMGAGNGARSPTSLPGTP